MGVLRTSEDATATQFTYKQANMDDTLHANNKLASPFSQVLLAARPDVVLVITFERESRDVTGATDGFTALIRGDEVWLRSMYIRIVTQVKFSPCCCFQVAIFGGAPVAFGSTTGDVHTWVDYRLKYDPIECQLHYSAKGCQTT